MIPVLALVGPTASGKTALGVALALEVGGEIVNADSMQLYEGMDIGTAKATEEDRRGVRHHLLDIWDIRQAASVEHYQRAARQVIAEIASRGKVPILVGGSGLYVRAALDVMDFPGTDPVVRGRLEAELTRHGAAAMHARLAQLAPDAAHRIPSHNPRRVVRALEVVTLTGHFSGELPPPTYALPAVQIGLCLPRDVLAARSAARVDAMWARGLVDEVRGLDARGLRQGITARRALGYGQVLRVLDGELDDAAARAETVRATRRYVRRQESWFLRDSRITWLDPREASTVGAAVAAYASAAGSPLS